MKMERAEVLNNTSPQDGRKRALLLYGGWEGHEPKKVADHFKSILEEKQIDATLTDTFSLFDSYENIKFFDVIIFNWTMGELSDEQTQNISKAVGSGTGLVGCHGGMCDAFRNNVLWQFMTGGNWVAHPGGDGIEYTVEIKNSSGFPKTQWSARSISV